jgi:NAD(P)-dependent dehydrogenase (short-subunit alcohol dehydrogenase family)
VEAELARLASHPRLELVEADLFDAEAVASVVSTAAAAPDAPLIAVANLVGGFAMGGRLHETPVDDYEQVLRLNLRPTYLVTRAAVQYLRSADPGTRREVTLSRKTKVVAGVWTQ